MTITTKWNGSSAVLALEGKLYTPTVPELEGELAKVLDSADSLTLDCSKLDYLSSAGLRVLFRVHQQMSSRNGMKLTNINETVREVLEVSGFADILTVE